MNNNHLQFNIKPLHEEHTEILVAMLADIDFGGFEEKDDNLIAYITEKDFQKEKFTELQTQFLFTYEETVLLPRNWNKTWESNFNPVYIDNFVTIRASFHKPDETTEHEVIITPKMSFGTGHHATTHMMIEQMRSIDFIKKYVLDFGTGTGVLAILAEKLGALKITALDCDMWSIKNAVENLHTNNCTKIGLKLSDKPIAKKKYDIILANINKNVIVQKFECLYNSLNSGGNLILSGFLREDFSELQKKAREHNLCEFSVIEKDSWICAAFS